MVDIVVQIIVDIVEYVVIFATKVMFFNFCFKILFLLTLTEDSLKPNEDSLGNLLVLKNSVIIIIIILLG